MKIKNLFHFQHLKMKEVSVFALYHFKTWRDQKGRRKVQAQV